MEFKVKSIGFELLNECNFNCVHCYLGKTENYMLDLDFIKKFISIFNNDFLWIYLTGGEPFTHPNFSGIYSELRHRGHYIKILTNCSIINKDILNIFEITPPHKIDISIYGMTEKTYSKVTMKNGYFKKVLNNVLELKKRNINITLNYNILSNNLCDLSYFVEYCKGNNIEFSVSPQIIPTLNMDSSPLNYRVSPNKVISILNKLNIDIKTIKEVQHKCAAGVNMFIDSKKVLKGCPILKTKYDLNLDYNIKKSHVINSLNKIKDFVNRSEAKICVGWTNLEDVKDIKKYIMGYSKN